MLSDAILTYGHSAKLLLYPCCPLTAAVFNAAGCFFPYELLNMQFALSTVAMTIW